MKISIIIPVYNQQDSITTCIETVLRQSSKIDGVEIIVIDDGSSDATLNAINSLAANSEMLSVLTNTVNEGPGIARNKGLDAAKGDWVLFLDSDDQLSDDAIFQLIQHISILESDLINQQAVDFIAYNFMFSHNKENATGERTDLASLSKDKQSLLNDYLSLKMDGSVIFTLLNREFVEQHHLRFFAGYHEDVDFMFKVYANAKRWSLLDEVLYIKQNRLDSIVNTVSARNINGMVRAYAEIYTYLSKKHMIDSATQQFFTLGVVALVATRLRQISQLTEPWALLAELKNGLDNLQTTCKLELKCLEQEFQTKYIKLFNLFNEWNNNLENESANQFIVQTNKILQQNWSCYDLQHSIFLAPDQIRTCCKRFFVNGEMKGDVALLTGQSHAYKDFNPTNIMQEKRNLFTEINKGTSDKCTGCDFLEFKAWNEFSIEHMSFEYHSVCNMKCTYCSETYYGGENSKYDVKALLNKLKTDGKLNNCKSIVWGGGEPTLGQNFEEMLHDLSCDFPSIQQRVITNATKISPGVINAMANNIANIVTSIDAGTKEKFIEVRQHSQFKRVLKNLKKYADTRAENVTIKYIFLSENSELSEVNAFLSEIYAHSLHNCNFQISFDFKREFVSESEMALITIMHNGLCKLGAPLVFLDDLLLVRIQKSDISRDNVNKYLEKYGYPEQKIDDNTRQAVVIWGAGMQTEALLSNDTFHRRYNVEYLVDNTPSKIGTELQGLSIYSPEVLLDSPKKVIISAVQNTRIIQQKYIALGLSQSDIIRDIIF